MTHGQYCERLETAMEDLRDRGEDFDGFEDPKVQHEITAQVTDGHLCSCGEIAEWGI